MNNKVSNELNLDTSVVFHENIKEDRHVNYDGFQQIAKVIAIATFLSTTGIAGATPLAYDEERSTTSSNLTLFNENYIAKTPFYPFTPTESFSSNDYIDDDYDEIAEILAYAHPEGVVREAKMQITRYEKGSINVPDELFYEFDDE